MSTQRTEKQQLKNLLIPRKVKSQQTMERVYAAVGDMLREYGYDYLTMRNICERAEVAYSSVYHFFGSKEQLVYQYCKKAITERMETALRLVNYQSGNYIEDLIYPMYTYLVLLEDFGWKTVNALYRGKEEDIFWATYGKSTTEMTLRTAFSQGYMIPNGRNRTIDMGIIIDLIEDDMKVLLSGAVLTWCRNMETQTPMSALTGLEERFCRVMNSFLLSWASPKYRAEFVDGKEGHAAYFHPETRNRLLAAIKEQENAVNTESA